MNKVCLSVCLTAPFLANVPQELTLACVTAGVTGVSSGCDAGTDASPAENLSRARPEMLVKWTTRPRHRHTCVSKYYVSPNITVSLARIIVFPSQNGGQCFCVPPLDIFVSKMHLRTLRQSFCTSGYAN